MHYMTPDPRRRPHARNGLIQRTRQSVDAFVAREGITWTILYVVAGIGGLAFLALLMVVAGN